MQTKIWRNHLYAISDLVEKVQTAEFGRALASPY
jgi:hypothetical protein